MHFLFSFGGAGRRSSIHFGGHQIFAQKNLSLHLNFARKNFQHICYGNGIKSNFRLQHNLLSRPKIAAHGLKLYFVMIESKRIRK